MEFGCVEELVSEDDEGRRVFKDEDIGQVVLGSRVGLVLKCHCFVNYSVVGVYCS